MEFTVRAAGEKDRDWILKIVRGWGADFVVSRGRRIFPADLPAYLAETDDGRRIGLATYEIVGNNCEIVTLDALEKYVGVGTALMQAVGAAARDAGCTRLWLITTNDNLEAIRFYQRRGMTIAAVHVNALEHSRQLKPSIPEIGLHGIPLRDEIEFEMML